MKVENTKIQMRKGILEYCILSIIAKREVYTSDIIDQLRKAKLIVVEGTIYPLLTRLKNSGYLSYKWQESTSGPPRKYFQLTAEGQIFLNELKVTWVELVEAVKNTTAENNTTNDKASNHE